MVDDYVYYCIPTYKSFDECRDAVRSLYLGSYIPNQVIIIDNSGDGSGTLALQHLSDEYKNVHIWPQSYNLGVSRAWNLFHREIKRDYIIIANDDVQVHENTVLDMLVAARENPDAPILYAGIEGNHNAYSLFLLREWAFIKYGGFDERFSPAYFEDNDMAYRLHKINGHAPVWVPTATYDHVGSSTIAKYNETEMSIHHSSFRANMSYYIAKWGGMPGQERYKQPFNGEI